MNDSISGRLPSDRLWAIGDIHGCHIALDNLLSQIAPQPSDIIVILGDVVDRGPGSRQVVDRLIRLKTECRLVYVMGNHEEMMLDALQYARKESLLSLEDWYRVGGMATIMSYGNSPAEIPETHLEFLSSGMDYCDTDEYLFIHANLEPGVELAEQSPEWLRWTHLTGFESPHPSGKLIICGHTPQRSGKPLVKPGWICIDTLAFGPGWLSALCLDNHEVLQTNQAGQFRSFVLTN